MDECQNKQNSDCCIERYTSAKDSNMLCAKNLCEDNSAEKGKGEDRQPIQPLESSYYCVSKNIFFVYLQVHAKTNMDLILNWTVTSILINQTNRAALIIHLQRADKRLLRDLHLPALAYPSHHAATCAPPSPASKAGTEMSSSSAFQCSP